MIVRRIAESPNWRNFQYSDVLGFWPQNHSWIKLESNMNHTQLWPPRFFTNSLLIFVGFSAHNSVTNLGCQGVEQNHRSESFQNHDSESWITSGGDSTIQKWFCVPTILEVTFVPWIGPWIKRWIKRESQLNLYLWLSLLLPPSNQLSLQGRYKVNSHEYNTFRAIFAACGLLLSVYVAFISWNGRCLYIELS